MSDKPRGGFREYFLGVSPVGTPATEWIFMAVVSFALMVALPAAIAGIFYGVARLGAAWGGGH